MRNTYKNIPTSIVEFRSTIKKYKSNIKHSDNEEKIKLLEQYRHYLDTHLEEYTCNAALEYWDQYIKQSHSIIRDIFSGLTYTSTRCLTCNITSLRFEPFIMLSIGIPNTKYEVTLEECLENYFATIELDNDNKYDCNNCKIKNKAIQNTKVWELPDILIIHFKRFSNEMYGRYCKTEKISTKIIFPLKDLDLNNICSSFNKKESKYDLYGVVQQFGTLSGGHYTACTKNAMNGEWYDFNDSNVKYIAPNKVNDDVVNNSAYILFYEKKYKQIHISDSDSD